MSGDKCPVTLTLDPGVVPACLPTAAVVSVRVLQFTAVTVRQKAETIIAAAAAAAAATKLLLLRRLLRLLGTFARLCRS